MNTDEVFASKVNNYLGDENYDGSTKVLNYLELLRDEIGFDKIKEKVKKKLREENIDSDDLSLEKIKEKLKEILKDK